MSDQTAVPFESLLEIRAGQVESFLDSLLERHVRTGEIDRPQRLLAAMRHGLLNGGKRLRPFLVIESARMLGCETSAPIHVAAALECVHSYSLVHDDLPAMDDDDLRRGQPTVHIAFDEATAILAGDALLTLAFDVLADDLETSATPAPPPSLQGGGERGGNAGGPPSPLQGGARGGGRKFQAAPPRTSLSSPQRLDLVRGLARAAGVGGMVGGQMLDLQAETSMPDEAGIIRLQAMKTGALIRYACEAGAILADGSRLDRERLAEFGSAIGLAFQLADDLLDLTSSTVAMGKATGKDAAAGKATLVALHGEAWARKQLRGLVKQAEELLEPYGDAADLLKAAARFVAERGR
jgi:farnesyl diphosphate synthase